MSIRQGGKIIAGNTSGRNIGDTFMTKRTDTSLAGAVECDGATYNTTDFTGDGSIGELLEAGKLDYVSLSAYSTAISTKGWCDKIGWDGAGNTAFRVPTLNAHIVQTNNIPVVGDGVTSPNFYTVGTTTAGGLYSNNGTLINGTPTGAQLLSTNPASTGMIADTSNTAQLRVMIQLYNGVTDEALATCENVESDIENLKDLSNITAAGKEVCANMAMPSDRYVDLTIGASGSTYTAPADGYITLSLLSTSTTAFAQLLTNKKVSISGSMCINGAPLRLSLPVAKSDVITVYYERGTVESLVFSYANGAQ